jgi:hypothetical protein
MDEGGELLDVIRKVEIRPEIRISMSTRKIGIVGVARLQLHDRYDPTALFRAEGAPVGPDL